MALKSLKWIGWCYSLVSSSVVFVSADPASHEENSSEVLSEPEVTIADPEPASSVIEENGVQKDAEHECTAVKIGRKQPTKDFTCPTCGKAFALKCLMNRHCLTHSKPHLCSECGKRFSGLRGLIAHSRKHTEKVRNGICVQINLPQAHASAQPKQTDHPHVLAVRGAVHGETGVSATHLLRVEEDICLLTLPRDLRVQAELGRS